MLSIRFRTITLRFDVQFKGITLRGESRQNQVDDDITINSCGFGEGPYTMPLCTVQIIVLHPDSVTEVFKNTVVAMESSTSCVHSQDNDSSFG